MVWQLLREGKLGILFKKETHKRWKLCIDGNNLSERETLDDVYGIMTRREQMELCL